MLDRTLISELRILAKKGEITQIKKLLSILNESDGFIKCNGKILITLSKWLRDNYKKDLIITEIVDKVDKLFVIDIG